MDNSQSSDVFSDPCFTHMPADNIVDETSYKSVVSRLKSSLSINVGCEVKEGSFSSHFTASLDDSEHFVCQSLDLISSLLEDPDIELSKLCGYMEDLALLLQLLTTFFKNVKEAAVSLNCSTMKLFPITTGQILVTVFTHCKESETLYGPHLGSLQKQLKDLFRTCHDLQLIYLTILEKHFVFDFTLPVELDILIEALNINLRIGEIVESLDLKTMAEQWKAYTQICEKYSNEMQDPGIFDTCTRSLAAMTMKNIELTLEPNQDQKTTLRSFKVSNFLIKILIKMCHIFKHGSERKHDDILDLLNIIYMNHSSHLLIKKKSPQLIHLMDANVVSVADNLVSELLTNTSFCDHLLQYDLNKSRRHDSSLGFIILLITITKSTIQRNDANQQSLNLMRCIFNVLPHCHVWFNLGLKFPISSKSSNCETYGLYEYLLSHAVALAATFEGDQYRGLEELMYGAVLGTDWCSALLATDLWLVLARMASPQMRLSQLAHLCKIHQELEKHKQFPKSPQRTHLSKLIEMLYKASEKEDKLKLHRVFNSTDDANVGLWAALKIRNLPAAEQKNSEECAVRKLKAYLDKLSSNSLTKSEMDCMIPLLKLVATCSFMRLDELAEGLAGAWLKCCPRAGPAIVPLGADDAWRLEFLTGLLLLTEAMIPVLQRNSEGLLKVLHVASGILSAGNLESKLVALPLTFKLALYNSPDNRFKTQMDQLFNEMFKEIFAETNFTLKNKLYEIIRSYCHNTSIKDLVSKVVSDDPLQEQWEYFQRYHKLPGCGVSWKEQLLVTAEASYAHKCLQGSAVIELSDTDSARCSGTFEFAELYSAFSVESDTDQPASKKAKLDTNEADVIISRIEKDVSHFANVKENVSISDYTNRILAICDNLKNIVN